MPREALSRGQAVRVARVLADVDGGCSSCQSKAAEHMQVLEPEHPWLELVMAVAEGMELPEGYERGAFPLPDYWEATNARARMAAGEEGPTWR